MAAAQKHVLLVDDDPAMLRLLGKWLEMAGYRTRRAADGKQAIAAIETECPQIVITDWEMPNMDGLDLCRWLRTQKLPHYVYTIFLTVRNSLEDIIKGLEAGADDFLKKPVDRGELLARLLSGERLVNLEHRLSIAASTDSLTGLYTRRTFFEHLSREWQQSVRSTTPLSCVILDVDFFKRINDTYGHPLGDEVLQNVAKILRDNVRSSDFVARYGGEEFCVTLVDTTEQQAMLWAERIRATIASSVVSLQNPQLRITASFGVAQRLDDTRTMESLIDMADQALLVAKRSGRNRAVLYHSLSETNGTICSDSVKQAWSMVPARDAMTTIVAPLHDCATVGDAAQYFLRFRISSTPVVNSEGCLIGVLSERDLMTTSFSKDWWATPVHSVMKTNVVSYDESTPVATIYDFLGRVAIRSVVITRNDRPVGLISRASLLRWLMNFQYTERMLDGNDDSAPHEPPKSPNRLIVTASALASEARKVEQHLLSEGTETVACLIGGVSRIQELVTDLLAGSRMLHTVENNSNSDDLGFGAAMISMPAFTER